MKKLLFVIVFAVIAGAAFVSVGATSNATIPPVENRLLILGDSLTSGLYASSEQSTFASIVANELDMQLARRHAATLDLAIAEWSNVRTWRPSLIVIQVGLNDVSKGKYDAHLGADYMSLVRDMQASGARVIVATMFRAGIKPSHPNYDTYLALNESIRQSARETGATLADLWVATTSCEACVSVPGDDSYFAPDYHGDGFHPNNAGHTLIAQVIIGALRCVCDNNAHEPQRYRTYFPNVSE